MERGHKLSISNPKEVIWGLILLLFGSMLPMAIHFCAVSAEFISMYFLSFPYLLPLIFAPLAIGSAIFFTTCIKYEHLSIQDGFIQSEKHTTIALEEIQNFRIINHRHGSYLKLSMKNGQKWWLAPSNTFTVKAEMAFRAFCAQFKKEMANL